MCGCGVDVRVYTDALARECATVSQTEWKDSKDYSRNFEIEAQRTIQIVKQLDVSQHINCER